MPYSRNSLGNLPCQKIYEFLAVCVIFLGKKINESRKSSKFRNLHEMKEATVDDGTLQNVAAAEEEKQREMGSLHEETEKNK